MFACRHHILEVHITHFNTEVEVSKTVGPENVLFKALKQNWNDAGLDIDGQLSRYDHKAVKGTWMEQQIRLAFNTCKNLKNRDILRNSEV